ncbi:restriction endonuclease subunit S [Streptomyces sp. RFCAC02]|uniref:restriction endonuclease subunit S n=1 Tax=Streptomyces sp. RFCAC02 TaxID=2499143 RepID=UPI00101FC682|nr:restriction endonuclease subunit S [Streptomyces sp. RFCAC02]
MTKRILEGLCELIVDCKNRTPPEASQGEGIAFAIGTPHIVDGRIRLQDAKRVTQETFETWTARAVPRAGDIVLTREAPVGRVGRVEEGMKVCLGQRTMLLRADAAVADSRFLHYLLLSDEVQATLHAHASGSTVPHLRVAQVRTLPIPVIPSLDVQKQIGTVLGGLDDKIAANERVAEKSLELADVQFNRAAQGLDFGAETFGSVAAVVGGGTPSTKAEDYWSGGIAWATPSDVTALSSPYLFETSRTITAAGLDNCASQLYPAHSIFMTSRATIGAFALPQIPAAANQGFIVVLPPSSEMRWWLLHEMRSRVDEMISLANGSTFLELSRKNFKAMPIRLPSGEGLVEFARIADSLHQRAAQASAENRALVALRDTLLPQLMSGKLRVRDAEQIVEDAV